MDVHAHDIRVLGESLFNRLRATAGPGNDLVSETAEPPRATANAVIDSSSTRTKRSKGSMVPLSEARWPSEVFDGHRAGHIDATKDSN
jgi:hypothetical protein